MPADTLPNGPTRPKAPHKEGPNAFDSIEDTIAAFGEHDETHEKAVEL